MLNNLKNEKSPYLLQHAENPVNWYAWGEEAFSAAKNKDKPVFLSIGYSTCHWCHVMARESFEDAEIAEILNKSYISVKVDREERQDVDAVYMSVCQAMTGSGGWPLTILMTPDKKPFFAGTYLPKESRFGILGLKELLLKTAQLWQNERQRLISAGDDIISFIRKPSASGRSRPFEELIQKGYEDLLSNFDRRYGGFGRSPKFPTPHNLMFLIEYSLLYKDERALETAERTLDCMFKGGIFDHIGGGFSRYCTDRMWLAPHFEKTLYDNALLAQVYLEAYRITNEPLYKRIAEKTLNYMTEELRDENGGFYCGQDADSDKVEGKYYVFTPDEISSALGEADSEYFCGWYAVTKEGNFHGKSIPNLLHNLKYREDNAAVNAMSEKLYAYRKNRAVLGRDDKILTSWNAMAITAFAAASFILKEPKYLSYAVGAQRFIENGLTDKDGKLFVRYRDGEAAFNGTVDDYAFYALALLELYKITFDAEWLLKASDTARRMIELFFNGESGGFYLYSKDSETLISRPMETYDGAIPSGNSAAAKALVFLAALTGEAEWINARNLQLGFLSCEIAVHPMASCFALTSMMKALREPSLLICVSSEKNVPEELVSFLRGCEKPDLFVLFVSSENRGALLSAVPSARDYPIPETGTAYYLCQNGACGKPAYNFSRIREKLERTG